MCCNSPSDVLFLLLVFCHAAFSGIIVIECVIEWLNCCEEKPAPLSC